MSGTNTVEGIQGYANSPILPAVRPLSGQTARPLFILQPTVIIDPFTLLSSYAPGTASISMDALGGAEITEQYASQTSRSTGRLFDISSQSTSAARMEQTYQGGFINPDGSPYYMPGTTTVPFNIHFDIGGIIYNGTNYSTLRAFTQDRYSLSSGRVNYYDMFSSLNARTTGSYIETTVTDTALVTRSAISSLLSPQEFSRYFENQNDDYLFFRQGLTAADFSNTNLFNIFLNSVSRTGYRLPIINDAQYPASSSSQSQGVNWNSGGVSFSYSQSQDSRLRNNLLSVNPYSPVVTTESSGANDSASATMYNQRNVNTLPDTVFGNNLNIPAQKDTQGMSAKLGLFGTGQFGTLWLNLDGRQDFIQISRGAGLTFENESGTVLTAGMRYDRFNPDEGLFMAARGWQRMSNGRIVTQNDPFGYSRNSSLVESFTEWDTSAAYLYSTGLLDGYKPYMSLSQTIGPLKLSGYADMSGLNPSFGGTITAFDRFSFGSVTAINPVNHDFSYNKSYAGAGFDLFGAHVEARPYRLYGEGPNLSRVFGSAGSIPLNKYSEYGVELPVTKAFGSAEGNINLSIFPTLVKRDYTSEDLARGASGTEHFSDGPLAVWNASVGMNSKTKGGSTFMGLVLSSAGPTPYDGAATQSFIRGGFEEKAGSVFSFNGNISQTVNGGTSFTGGYLGVSATLIGRDPSPEANGGGTGYEARSDRISSLLKELLASNDPANFDILDVSRSLPAMYAKNPADCARLIMKDPVFFAEAVFKARRNKYDTVSYQAMLDTMKAQAPELYRIVNEFIEKE